MFRVNPSFTATDVLHNLGTKLGTPNCIDTSTVCNLGTTRKMLTLQLPLCYAHSCVQMSQFWYLQLSLYQCLFICDYPADLHCFKCLLSMKVTYKWWTRTYKQPLVKITPANLKSTCVACILVCLTRLYLFHADIWHICDKGWFFSVDHNTWKTRVHTHIHRVSHCQTHRIHAGLTMVVRSKFIEEVC